MVVVTMRAGVITAFAAALVVASAAAAVSDMNATDAAPGAELVLAGEPVCEVCHIRYHQTPVSLPQGTPDDEPFAACRQYEKVRAPRGEDDAPLPQCRHPPSRRRFRF